MTSADELVADYLKRLERELSDLPRGRRREIADEVSAHIAEARASGDVESEAEMLTLLDRVGAPDEIAAEARARLDLRPAKPGSREVWALILLAVGGFFVPLIGWLVGVYLLWSSAVWSRTEKLIGTLATVELGGGLIALAFLAQRRISPSGANSSTSTSETLLGLAALLLFVLGIAVVTYLAVRLRQRSKVAARLAQ
jgi:uncharacterized membrane protein